MQPIDIHLVWILVAGKGLGEDVTNGAAREGRARDERVRKKGKGGGNRDEPEAVPEP
jgi:hypothetical protein